MNRFTFSKFSSAVTLCLASFAAQAQAAAAAPGSTQAIVCAVADDLTFGPHGIVKPTAQGIRPPRLDAQTQ